MAEETENDGSWSGLVKTIVGTVGTIVTAGGAWLGSQLFGGEEKAEAPAQTVAAPAPVINITNANQQAAAPAGKTVIVQQAAPAAAPVKPKAKTAKEELEEAPKW